MGPHEPFTGKTDNEVLAIARDVHARMIRADRDSDSYPGLLVAWREVCQELNWRGMDSTVTEGGTVRLWEC